MYSINPDNTITPLQKRSFKDLHFSERAHLQEWLAKHSAAFGARPDGAPELLIIQKEFAGFDKTQERLDLLALDRRGHIVVIENKLDDSGRDVTWQALKYAAYCSTLKTDQIVEIYSRYLGKPVDEAREAIAEFMEQGDADELTLNTANSQRIIFVAASFRPEITATALWLLGKGVNITCFQVTPFSKGTDNFLTVEQIIPPPEAADYMIRLAEKSAVEETQSASQSARHIRRRHYWEALMKQWEVAKTIILLNRTPSNENWITISSGTSGVTYALVILRQEVKVQLNFETPGEDRNTRMYHFLNERRLEIEEQFGAPLHWQNTESVKSCRIIQTLPIDTTDPENWPEAIEWQRQRMEALMQTLKPYIPKIAAL
jgi:hypothetical protein